MIGNRNRPLTPNQRIVKALSWDERAEEYLVTWGLSRRDAERIIEHDHKPVLDAHSTEAGHPIVRFSRGDVTVVVGFRDPTKPKVLSVFVRFPKGKEMKDRTSTSSGSGTSLPTSGRQLKQWIIAFGYKLEFARGGHLRVVNKETGIQICQIAATPSDHRTIANEWRRFLKEHAQHEANEKKRK